MKTIEEIKELLKNCNWNSEPRKKTKGYFGMPGSSMLDKKTEKEAWNAWYDYCLKNNQIN